MFAKGPMPGRSFKAEALAVLPAGTQCERLSRMGITGFVVTLPDGRRQAWNEARAWAERRAEQQRQVDKQLEAVTEAEIAALLAERERTMQAFSPEHRGMAIYAVVRQDLAMDAGKLASQAGHAYGEAIEHADPALLAAYKGSGHGTKLCMGVRNEGQLKRVYREAKAAGLPCYLVIDRGHVQLPHFTGKPLLTAVAIGPVYKDEAASITRRLTLIK